MKDNKGKLVLDQGLAGSGDHYVICGIIYTLCCGKLPRTPLLYRRYKHKFTLSDKSRMGDLTDNRHPMDYEICFLFIAPVQPILPQARKDGIGERDMVEVPERNNGSTVQIIPESAGGKGSRLRW